MDELNELLEEWTVRVRDNRVTYDDHSEWRTTITQAVKSVDPVLLSNLRFQAGFIGWDVDESDAYKRRILSDIRNIRDTITANQRFPTKQIDTKKVQKPFNRARSVFIIHGHNDANRESVARFIEKIGLDPIILFERPNGGKTIIEKFEKEADVGFAIALLTADDTAICKRDQKQETRARQNVVFEMGYFVAKLGRDRVAVLKENGVAEPSDLHGIVYTELDNKGAWKFELAKELRAAGFDIDINKVI